MKKIITYLRVVYLRIIKNNYYRIGLAFLFALFASSYIMDFATLGTPLRNANFTSIFTHFLVQATELLIHLAEYETAIYNSSIMFTPENGVYFDFGCLGYREIIWFSSFMILIYGPIKHKLWYIPIGIIVLITSNILRAFVIAITNFHSPQSFELIHVQGSLWYMYGTILTLWLAWLYTFNPDYALELRHEN